MITHYFRTVKDTELKILDNTRTGVWTHVVNPTDEDLVTLVREYSLDEAILEDARDFFEVPRLERSQGATYFFTRYPYDEKEEDTDTAPLLVIMGESFVVTIALRDVPQFKHFVDGKIEVHTTQKAKFFIQIISSLITSYERELMRLRKAVQRDRSKLRSIGNRDIQRLVNYEHTLNDMVSALVPTNSWLQTITSGNYMQLYNEDVELMQDLMIANSQLVDSARSLLKTIQNIRTATEAILTNNLNATIRTLTVITILLTIPTIVSSLYGMNVALPLMQHPYAFWMVVVFIVIVVIGVGYYFHKNKWL